MSNAFTFSSASDFARKATLDCVLPAIGVALFHKECGFSSNAQLGLAAFAIHTALSCLPDTECKVLNVEMIGYMANAIEQVHTLNRDKKDCYITHTPAEMLAFTVAMRWMSISVEGMMSITDKWVQLTTGSRALLPVNQQVSDETRRVPYVKGNKVPGSTLLKEAEQFLSDTAYHVESKVGLAVHEYLENWKRENANKGMFAKLPTRIDAEMYVHKGSELVHSEPELFSEYTADARFRLYHAACFGPNPQSGDMARAYYSHNVENWVEKDSEAYEIFMTELADVAGSDEWLQPAFLRASAKNPSIALDKILKREEGGQSIPSKPLTYIRMALDWLEFEENGKCDSRLGFGEDAKCSGTQILAILAGAKELIEATGFRLTGGKSADPYMLCLTNIEALLDINPLRHYIMDAAMKEILTRNFAKRPYMSVQYGGGKTALLENKDFIVALDKLGLAEEQREAFVALTLEAVKRTLGDRINHMIEAIQTAVNNKLALTGKQYLTYTHIDGAKVLKPCFTKDIPIADAFAIRVAANVNVNFGNVKEGTAWSTEAREPTAEEFTRTFVVNYVQGIDALIARTVAVKAKEAGLRGFTSIHDCFRVCLADAPKLHKVIADAYKEIFVDNDPLKHLAEQLGGINYHAEKVLTDELIYSEHSYFFTAH